LRIEYPHDLMMRVSDETIYQALYVQGRGELRHELARCLRTDRAKRAPGGRGETTGQLRGMVMIGTERPGCWLPLVANLNAALVPRKSQPGFPLDSLVARW
jgi:hypothetical protein